MNIAALLQPSHDTPSDVATPFALSASLSQQQEQQQRQQEQDRQPGSAYPVQQHAGTLQDSRFSSPPSQHVLLQRMRSSLSSSSFDPGSTHHTPGPLPLALQHHQGDSTARRRSSACSSCATTRPRRRGTQTKAACVLCQKRKSKCDGIRPSCGCCISKAAPCNYRVPSGVTQQQASKNQHRAYKQVLSLLRKSTLEDTAVLVNMLKARDNLSDAVEDISTDMRQTYTGGLRF